MVTNDGYPLFSILVANYNNGYYLQAAIESVISQDYPSWEIIIVDDGSSDESSTIYGKYSDDKRIHVFYNDTNRGVGFTKRRCVDNAHGDLCCFLDPDDVLVGKDVLSIMAQEHINHPEVSMVYSGMYRADEKLTITSESPGLDIPPFESALHTRDWPFHPVVAFKMSSYLKTEGIDAFMRNAEDYDLYYKLEEVGDILHVNRIQYIQRNNPHSISLNGNSYKAAVWHSYACIKAMKRRGIDDESLMLFPVEYALKKAYKQGYEKATSSRIYRLGKGLVYPILLLSRIWKR